MKPKKIMLLIWVLTAQLTYSQNVSIHKEIIGKDTGCWVPIKDIRQYNLEFVKMDFYKDQVDTFRILYYKVTKKASDEQLLINNYEQQSILKQAIIANENTEIKKYADLDKQSQNKIKFLKIQRNVLAIGVVVAIIKIFVF